jgi:hypothetical protein
MRRRHFGSGEELAFVASSGAKAERGFAVLMNSQKADSSLRSE